MDKLLSKRLILVTGKGGVGRSTVSAALALAGARLGRRVLLTEFRDASGDYSPLARLFGLEELPTEPVVIDKGIRGCALHAWSGHIKFLHSVMPIKAVVRAAVQSKALTHLLDAAPSLHEMGSFYHLLSLLQERWGKTDQPEHELIVIDMPATGHALALTSLPDVILNFMPKGPIAASMRAGQGYVNNPEKCGSLIVTLPETLPVTECLELMDGLRKTNVPIAGVVVNRLEHDEFEADEREALDAMLEAIPLYGAIKYRNLTENKRAVARLRASTDVPILLVPDLEASGQPLISAIASVLHPAGEV